MGYTNYWYRKPELDSAKFERATKDINAVIAKCGVVLAGGHGNGRPTIDAEKNIFNGHGEMGHESFYVPRVETIRDGMDYAPEHAGKAFAFCKTAQKPYDVAVQASLIVLKHHFGDDIHVKSDGDNEDWDEGRILCEEALGYGKDFML